MISIIGGTKKRTNLSVPNNNVRPTSVHKREAIFSIIENYGLKMNFNIYKNANVLDLFAGSGALGLEAISRGSAFGYFYENNTEIEKNLKKNCLKICKKNNFKIKHENILESNFKDIDKKIALVFIDPPYKINPFEQVLHNLIHSSILLKKSLIILECSLKLNIQIPSSFSCINEKVYGKTKIFFLVSNIYK